MTQQIRYKDTHEEMKSTWEKRLQSVHGSAKYGLFLPDVIKILNIITKVHNFSESYIQYIGITITEMIFLCKF